MNNVVAIIYIVLAVITIILFILTRFINIRIIKEDNVRIFISTTFFELILTKQNQEKLFDIDTEYSVESEINPNFQEILSLLSTIAKYFKKAKITVRKCALTSKLSNSNIYYYCGLWAVISAVIVYIDSQVEKLDIKDNAFTLSSDKKTQLDISFSIMLLDLFILVIRLILGIIKMEKMEKVNVGN